MQNGNHKQPVDYGNHHQAYGIDLDSHCHDHHHDDILIMMMMSQTSSSSSPS